MKNIFNRLALCFMCVLFAVMPAAGKYPAQAAAPKAESAKIADKKKVLIAYYSQSGTTKKVAKRIQKMTGADLFQIKAKKKYPSDYDKLTEIALEEQEAEARPALKNKVKSIKKYDVIMLGYPIWWSDAPMAVYTFLETHNLKGKTIIPFCTSGGTDISESVKHIRKVCGKKAVKKGLTANSVSDGTIRSWLKKNGVPVKQEVSVKLQLGKADVTNKTFSMKAGAAKTIKAKSSHKISTIKYASSNAKVASVNKKGTVKAKKSGTAKITAAVTTKQGNKIVWTKVKVSAAEPKPEPEPTTEPEPEPEPTTEPSQDNGKILVAYFTRTGNTEKVADIISEKTGGEKILLETVKTYPSDYSGVYDEALKERNENARPELKTKIEDMDAYDTVFIGYPIWHGDTPMAVRTFLEEYNFTGKKVIPFCTSASSGPDTSFNHVKESAEGAEVLEGFWSGSSGMGKIEETVPKWLEGLGIIKEDGKEGDVLKITVGNTVFRADFADNSSAAALKEMLAKEPLTIDMHDYANMEKVGPVGKSLPRNDEQITTSAGDIILYQGNSLVIYYDNNEWSLTKIAKIRDVTGEELKKALGTGDVTVTFSI